MSPAGPAGRIDELKKRYDENPRRFFAPLANEYRKAGDLEAAIDICRMHLEEQPTHMSGHIVYGQALFEAGQLDAARQTFETAIQLDPENLIALRHLGDIARRIGDRPRATKWYQRVLDEDPRNDEIQGFLVELGDTATPGPAAAGADVLPLPPDERDAAPDTSPAERAVLESWDAFDGVASPVPVPTPVPSAPEPSTASGDRSTAPKPMPGAEASWAESRPREPEPPREAPTPGLEGPVGDPPSLGFDAPGTSAPHLGFDAPLDEPPSLGFDAPFVTPAISDPGPAAPSTAPPARRSHGLQDLDLGPLDQSALPPLDVQSPLRERTSGASSAPLTGGADARLRVTEPASQPTSPPAVPPPPPEDLAHERVEEDLLAPGSLPVASDRAPADPVAPHPAAPNDLFGDADTGLEARLSRPLGEVTSSEAGAGDIFAVGADLGRTTTFDDWTPAQPVSPTPAFVTETMAELYLEQGFRDEALDIYRQLLTLNPSDPALLDRIRHLEGGGRSSMEIAEVRFEQASPAEAPVPIRDPAPLPTLLAAEPAAQDTGPTAREFFLTFARYAMPSAPAETTPAPSALVQTAPEPPAQRPSQQVVPMPPLSEPESLAFRPAVAHDGPLDRLFRSGVSTDDESAARALATLATVVGDATPALGVTAAPDPAEPEPHPHRSLGALSPEDERGVQRQSQLLRFDQFFAASSPEAAPEPSDSDPQFDDWLKALEP